MSDEELTPEMIGHAQEKAVALLKVVTVLCRAAMGPACMPVIVLTNNGDPDHLGILCDLPEGITPDMVFRSAVKKLEANSMNDISPQKAAESTH